MGNEPASRVVEHPTNGRMSSEPAPLPAEEEPVVEHDTAANRVLAIEDSAADAELLGMYVRQARREGLSLELTVATTLERAREALEGQAFDAVLADLNLPDANGLDVVNAVGELAPHLPIIVLTGKDDDRLARAVLESGADDYVVKGRTRGVDLVVRIVHTIERRRMEEALREANQQLAGANKKLERLVQVDPLTGVLNRRGLEDALARETSRALRNASTMVAILLDCDDFKRVNDKLGHAAGDVVLRTVARFIQESVRPTDHVARVGGDEFLILLPDTRFPEAMLVAERLRLAIARSPLEAEGDAIEVTASLGVAQVPASVSALHELFALTRLALKSSKLRGKNCVATQESVGEADPLERTSLVEGLVSGASLAAIAQSIVRVRDGSVIGVEMLARGPEGPFQNPNDFFRLALDADVLPSTDLSCLKVGLAESQKLSDVSRVHVNVFPATLVATPVDRFVEMFPADDRIYCVEISERQFIGDPAAMLDVVSVMREAGLQIGIDDVGFGRSSLETLLLLNPDVVKIDRSYVHKVSDDPTLRHALARLLRVVRSLDAEVIAEGCELEADRAMLESLDVRYAQGFLWD